MIDKRCEKNEEIAIQVNVTGRLFCPFKQLYAQKKCVNKYWRSHVGLYLSFSPNTLRMVPIKMCAIVFRFNPQSLHSRHAWETRFFDSL